MRNPDEGIITSGDAPAGPSDRGARGLRGACPADFNGDGQVNPADFFAFLQAYFSGSPSADFNHDGHINSQDFFDFLTAFFARYGN